MAILDTHGAGEALREAAAVVSADEVMAMIDAVRTVHLADALKGYLVDLAEASRRHPAIVLGLSPRATLQLAAGARARAAAQGRDYATPDDVKAVAVGCSPTASCCAPIAAPASPRRGPRSARSSPTCRYPVRDADRACTAPTRQGIVVVAVGLVARSSSAACSVCSSCTSSVPGLVGRRARSPGSSSAVGGRASVVGRWIRPSVLTAGDVRRASRSRRRAPAVRGALALL